MATAITCDACGAVIKASVIKVEFLDNENQCGGVCHATFDVCSMCAAKIPFEYRLCSAMEIDDFKRLVQPNPALFN